MNLIGPLIGVALIYGDKGGFVNGLLGEPITKELLRCFLWVVRIKS